MDIQCFYGQEGQIESLRTAHQMLQDAENLRQLGEATAREKAARNRQFVGEICGATSTRVETRDGCVERRRKDFDSFIWRHYRSKVRHRTVIDKPSKLSIADRRIRDRFAIGRREGREALLRRGTQRVFVPVEEVFPELLRLHAQVGHSQNRTLVYESGKARFANIGLELVREFLRGYEKHVKIGADREHNS